MKWYLFPLVLFFLIAPGCANERRNEALDGREAALNAKEQELYGKEKTLQLQEESLRRREQSLDSAARPDSSRLVNPALAGNWSVQMTCTEATCTGSAVGDTKSEDWNLSYQGNALIARASSGGQLVRTYTGFYTGNTVELVEHLDTTGAVKMVVRLRPTDATHMEGQREITREACKVIYDLKLVKND
jgi:hypothetical protein